MEADFYTGYQTPSKEEMEALCIEHEKWLHSNGHEGIRATLENLDLTKTHLNEISFSLYGKNLSKAFIENVNFTGSYLESVKLIEADLKRVIFESANLNKSTLVKAKCYDCSFDNSFILDANLGNSTFEKCRFKKAKLDGSDLRNSEFSQSNFEEASLLRAKLNESNFQDSNFEKVTGLLGSQLAGTNVSGAKIPEDIRKFEGLTRIEELSKKSGKLFILMLVGCLYSWLTVATTTDSQLFLNSKYYNLPIIQTAIPITPFFYVAPLILLGIYIWFHLYLQRLWEEMALLPAIFPDGKPLDQKVFPWLLSGFIRAYIPRLQTNLPDLFVLQFIASFLLAWCLTPFILSLFWVRVIPTHDGIFMSVLAAIFSIALGFGSYFFSLAGLTLSKTQNSPKILIISWILGISIFVLTDQVGLATLGITRTQPWPVIVLEPEEYKARQESRVTLDIPENLLWLTSISNAVLKISQKLGLRTYAEFHNEELSKIPDNWNNEINEISKVKGTYLGGKNLRFARAEGVFWVNSNFAATNLSYAYLFGVDLRKSDFERANLTRAFLNINLEEGKLTGANLTHAILMGGNYKKTDLRGTNLEKALIINTKMAESYLAGANFQSTTLVLVNFDEANFSGGYPRFKDPKNFPNFGFFDPVEGSANFSNATLRSVSFDKANLKGVAFSKTKLFDVDLSETLELTQEQIDEACVDKKTKLPVGIKRPDPCP
ncbi:pentapeptide repeat-containing protein [Nitrospira sp. MA-1]|nr:pentapeptide repeat-containing protein [Nitrospira sp. MA-1]